MLKKSHINDTTRYAFQAGGVGELVDHYAGFVAGDVLQTILVVVNLFVSGLSWFLGIIMSFLSFVMEWQVATNNEVVQVAWAMGRDISNIFFIVGLIIIAFATMFRTFGVLQSFHWKTALPRLLVAAILINLSLAMSQTVVLVSNKITMIMGGIIENSGFQIARVLKTSTLKNNFHVILSQDQAAFSDPGLLDLREQTRLAARDNPKVRAAIEECQTEESQVNATFWQRMADKAPRLALAPLLGPVGFVVAAVAPVTSFDINIDTSGVRKSYQECIDEYVAAQQGIGDRAAAYLSSLLEWTGNTKATAYIYFIIMGILNLFMLAMVIISLGSAVLFYMLRVMAIWILLFLSSFAFGFSWIPGAQSLKRWWNIFLGWNAFGPVYLFFLIIGMSFLARQGDLVAALNTNPEVGAVGGLFQVLFFYIFAAIVFVGGLMLALNSSFAAAVKTTPVLGGVAERVGVFSATKWSQAFGRRVFQATRAPAYFQATRERLAQEYRERRPEILRIRTQEEMTAAARARLGVYGGTQETYSLRKGRIDESSKRLDSALQGIVDTDPGKQHKNRMEFLRDKAESRNRDEAIAARQQLLKFGDEYMDAPRIKEMQSWLPGGIAQAEFAKTMRTGEGIDPLIAFREAVVREPGKDSEHAERYFGKLLRNPNLFGKLGYSYIDPGAKKPYTDSLDAMKIAANRIWPPDPTHPNSKESRARYQAEQKLKRTSDDPRTAALATKIFS